MSNALRVKRFDPRSIKPHRICLFVGCRGSGKTHCMNSVIAELANTFHFGLAFSPTHDTTSEWAKYMPRSWIYERYCHDKVEDMINVQKRALRDGKEPKALFILLDDCIYDKTVLASTVMRELFQNGRHLRIHLSIAVQYLVDMSPALRSNVDYVFSTKEKILVNRIKLHKYFFGLWAEFKNFDRVFDACTQAYSTIVLDNTAKSSAPEDCVFWYRAPESIPECKIGHKVFWTLSEKHAKTEEQHRAELAQREAQEKEDIEKKRRKKEPLVVSVQDDRGNWVSSTAYTIPKPNSPRIRM
jgi:hypothetical protein